MPQNFQANLIAQQDQPINYRNAIYQGSLMKQSIRSGYGIVYIANTHQFIVCTNWLNDQVHQNCLFYNSDQNYCYGQWLNNKPHGLNLFRLGQIVLIGQFSQGKIQKGTKIIIHYQKYSVAAVFIVKQQILFQKLQNQLSQTQQYQSLHQNRAINSQNLELYLKKQLLSNEELIDLYLKCGWNKDDYQSFQSLIRFMYTRMNFKNQGKSSQKVKLRLINNSFYRFGFDHGLAVVFNDQYKRVSVGFHNKTKLSSYGASFTHSSLGSQVQQGIFNQNQQIFVFSNQSRPQSKIGKIYSSNLLMGINFVNKFYQNASALYIKRLEVLLHSNLLKSMVSGYITTKRLLETSDCIQKIQTKIKTSPQNNQLIPQQNVKTHMTEIQQQKMRLEAIKKEIYNSIQRRKNQVIKQKNKQIYSQQNPRIINYEQVGTKSKVSHKQIDRTPQKTDKSRSKKKIFKQLKNGEWVPSQFSPDQAKSSTLSPFKHKMKHKIFENRQKDPNRLSPHINKSPRSTISMKHPHSSYKVLIQTTENKQQKQSILQYQSPYQKFNTNTDQQVNQTKIKVHYPITSTKKSKLKINESQSPHANSYLQYNQNQEQPPKTQYIRIDQRQLAQISAKKRSLKDKSNKQQLIKVLQNIQKETSSKSRHKHQQQQINNNIVGSKKIQVTSNNKSKNSVYLHKPEQKSKSKSKNQPQFYQNRGNPYRQATSNYEKQLQRSNSYMSKHHKKKQIEREIQKSPDRYRCYGRDTQQDKQRSSQQKSNYPYIVSNYDVSNKHSTYSQFQYQKMF